MKTAKCLINLYTIIILICFCSLYSHALEKETHAAINEYIAISTLNNFSFDKYLKDQLGFQKGKDEEFINNKITKKAFEWLGEGGRKEDEPFLLRSLNHFHNPLTNEGYSGIWNSSIVWSQLSGGQTPGGFYSWQDVRGYYYMALTRTDKTTREANFAETFRGLGQLMHLVQDLSVPEHTRDDGHILPAYEAWAGNPNNVEFNPKIGKRYINDTTIEPIFFDSNKIGDESKFTNATVPIANLFDTNQYIETNPDPSVTLRSDIGLSEYTNANFLSADTMFVSDFPYPSAADCIVYHDKDNKRRYLSNNNEKVKGEKVTHLATVSWLHFWRQRYFPQEDSHLPVALDDLCYAEYASNLIPRAVGYSAELLNYFFRGAIEISAPERFLYSIIDGSISPQQFTYIKAKLKNITPNEEMGSGSVLAIAKYKKRTDYEEDLSNDPPTKFTREDHFSYSYSAPKGITSIDSETGTDVTFDFSKDPIPAGITDLYLQVVFEGTLGNEENIAVVVGMKDLNEPMHICSWNSTEMVYLYEHLYTADAIRSDNNLLKLIPYGFNIDPYNNLITGSVFYLGDTMPTYYHTYNNPLPPAHYNRIIIITDAPSFNICAAYKSDNPYVEFYWKDIFPGVINQDDSEGNFQSTQPFTFRGIKAHKHYGFFIEYPYDDDTGLDDAPWPYPSPVTTYIYP